MRGYATRKVPVTRRTDHSRLVGAGPALLFTQLIPFTQALRERTVAVRSDAGGTAFISPQLTRLPALEADLAGAAAVVAA